MSPKKKARAEGSGETPLGTVTMELEAGDQDALNASYTAAVAEAWDTIRDDPRIDGVVQAEALQINDGGRQAPSHKKDFIRGITQGGDYICGTNLAWVSFCGRPRQAFPFALIL